MYKISIRNILLLSVGLTLAYTLSAEGKSASTRGELNLTGSNHNSEEVIGLSGIWEFYWKQLIAPNDFDTLSQSPSFITVPSVWNDLQVGDIVLTGEGFATYRLLIYGSFKGKQMALEIPAVFNAYKLWLNGQVLSSNGEPGNSLKTSKALWLPLTKEFMPNSDTLEIVMHVSNFRHKKGGVPDVIFLGSAEKLNARRSSRFAGNVMLIIGLSVIGIVFMVLYFFFGRNDVSFLLFAGWCLGWAVRAFCTDLYLLNVYLKDFDWGLAMKIEYSTLYVAVIFGLMFIAKSYPSETNKLFRNIGAVVSSLFVLVTFIASTLFASYLLAPFQFFAAIVMIYVINIILNALINARDGAVFSSLGLLFLILTWFYDLLAYYEVFELNLILLNLSYLATFSIYAVAIIYKKLKNSAAFNVI